MNLVLIIIAFFSLIALIIIHELGHFLLAKKFGIKVEEFGIGYPPRLLAKKIGETVYSLNLLPFGAFVKIHGHEDRLKGPDSFMGKPIWQRALVILGGVISFWIVAAALLTVVMVLGVPIVVDDNESENLVNSKVQIVAISKDSPAQDSGLELGDIIRRVRKDDKGVSNVTKVKEVQDFTNSHKGEKIALTIQRGKNIFEVFLTPRISFPQGEGAMGVGLLRTALRSYPWYLAPFKGIAATGDLTLSILEGWKITLSSVFLGKGVPSGVEVRGIVGIFELFVQVGGLGATYFLQFIAIISVSLALINALPLPALDGGWFVLLMIEKFRGRPINHKTEQIINSAFFFLLIALMVWITIKDIIRLF